MDTVGPMVPLRLHDCAGWLGLGAAAGLSCRLFVADFGGEAQNS